MSNRTYWTFMFLMSLALAFGLFYVWEAIVFFSIH